MSSPRVKHNWYQTQKDVVVDIFVRNRTSEDVQITLEEELIDVIVKLDSEGSEFAYEFQLDGEIVPNESKVTVTRTKIEVKCRKKMVGRSWIRLERIEPDPKETADQQKAKVEERDSTWKDLLKETEKEEEQGLQQLFQGIFSNADPDTRRAMEKSFVESGGTVLSTNWSEVGSKKVEVQPPKGVEPRKME